MPETDPSVSAADGEESPPTICPVCPHRRADHDAIANRFCSARIAGGGGRGCVYRTTG